MALPTLLVHNICLKGKDWGLLGAIVFAFGTGLFIFSHREEEGAVKVHEEIVAPQDKSSCHR